MDASYITDHKCTRCNASIEVGEKHVVILYFKGLFTLRFCDKHNMCTKGSTHSACAYEAAVGCACGANLPLISLED